MLFQTIEAVGKLAVKIGELTQATNELVEVTKACHRERVIQLRQEMEQAKGNDDPKLSNFGMYWVGERLAALEIATGGRLKPNGDSS